MSINSTQSIKCPKCGQLHNINIWSLITANDSADLKRDILSRKINVFTCDICGQIALMPSPLLYTDNDKKLMISFTPCTDKVLKLQLFDNMKNTSKQSGELENFENYNLRFVTDYNDLIEKILIFDNNLNDKVIEFLKMLILVQEPQKAENRIAMFGKIDGDKIEFLVQDKSDGQVYTSLVPMSTYETIKAQLLQSGVKLYSFDWEIVDLDYSSTLLNGINNI